jgi:hypothetical protein
MDFDSKFSGYVQNAVRISPDEISVEIMQLVAEHDLDVVEGSLMIVPFGKGYEVRLTYRVPLGLGGFAYIWEKDIVARTRFGGAAELRHRPALGMA